MKGFSALKPDPGGHGTGTAAGHLRRTVRIRWAADSVALKSQTDERPKAPIPLMSLRYSRFLTSVAALGLVANATLTGCDTTTSTSSTDSSSDQSSRLLDGDRPGGPPAKAYETFDMVWTLVDTRHFDPEHNGVDWDGIREIYRPRVSNVRTNAELRRLLRDMLDELGQTHFVIIPAEASPPPMDADVVSDHEGDAQGDADASEEDSEIEVETGTFGIRLAWLDDDVVVSRVHPGSEADAAGIRPGWMVERVEDIEPASRLAAFRKTALESGTPFAEYESIEVLNTLVQRPVGKTLRLQFRDGEDREVEHNLTSQAVLGERATFGLLPESPVVTETELLSEQELRSFGIEWDGNDAPRIARMKFNIWMFPILIPIAEAVDQYRDVDGFIIDLRENPGGIGGLAMGVAGHFLATDESLGDMKMRDTTMHFKVNPQRATPDGRLVDPFSGPVAIVVDRCSASTSEVFAAGLQQLGRAAVVGRPTAGAALPAHFARLPNEDAFMFAVADFIGPAGTSIEGTGVIPDIKVPIDRDLLLTEGDPDIAAATRWIVSELDDPTS